MAMLTESKLTNDIFHQKTVLKLSSMKTSKQFVLLEMRAVSLQVVSGV